MINVDVNKLKVFCIYLDEHIEDLTRKIYKLAGEEFNINSPKQLGVILFEKLGLPAKKRTKSGYSTNAEVLEYIVAPDTAITKKPLKDMNFPRNAIVGGVIRGNESYIAVGDTHIQAYDRVAVFALPEAVKEVDKFFR